MGVPASARWGSSTRPNSLGLIILLAGLLLIPASSLQQQSRTPYVSNKDATCQAQAPCYATIQAAVDTVARQGWPHFSLPPFHAKWRVTEGPL